MEYTYIFAVKQDIRAIGTDIACKNIKIYSMKTKLLFLLGFILPVLSFSQTIYSVDYANQADVKVFVVDYENQCDLKVFKVDYANQVDGNQGLWYFVDYPNMADKKIYFVDYVNQSDLKVFFVKYRNQAGWRNKGKQQVMY